MQTRTEQAYEALRIENRVLAEEFRGQRMVMVWTLPPPPRNPVSQARLRGWLVGGSWALLWTVFALIWGVVNPAAVTVFAPAGFFMAIGLSAASARAAFDAGEEAAVCAALFSIAVTQFWGAQETLTRTLTHDAYWIISALITIVLIGGFGPVWKRIKELWKGGVLVFASMVGLMLIVPDWIEHILGTEQEKNAGQIEWIGLVAGGLIPLFYLICSTKACRFVRVVLGRS